MPSSFPKSVLITGANRGIGFGLVQQFLKHPEVQHIFATARDVQKADALKAINDPLLHILPLDVTCDKSIDFLVQEVGHIVGENGLNLLINNAGIAVKYSTSSEPSRKTLREQLEVNIISVVIISQKFLPLLEKGVAASTGTSFTVARGAIITISSTLGSIGENINGSGTNDALAYRMSKTAVNQFIKTVAIDLHDSGILAVAFCPGWVQTDMGTDKADLTVEQSTSALVDCFSKLTEEHNGGYYRHTLEKYPY